MHLLSSSQMSTTRGRCARSDDYILFIFVMSSGLTASVKMSAISNLPFGKIRAMTMSVVSALFKGHQASRPREEIPADENQQYPDGRSHQRDGMKEPSRCGDGVIEPAEA